MDAVDCTEKMTFGPSENEVWLEIGGLEWSPRKGTHWIMSVPGGTLELHITVPGHYKVKTLRQARNQLLDFVCIAEEKDQDLVPGIEEMFVPVIQKGARRERAVKALREIIRLEDGGSATLEEVEAGLRWIRANMDLAKKEPAEIQQMIAAHDTDETGRIAAEKLLNMRNQNVQEWRTTDIRDKLYLGFSPRGWDLESLFRRLDIDEKTLKSRAYTLEGGLMIGEVEDALLYLNCDERIEYMKEGTSYSPDAGLAALTKIEGLLNRKLRAA